MGIFRWCASWLCLSRILSKSQPVDNPQILEIVERIRQLFFINGIIRVRTADLPVTPYVYSVYRQYLFLPKHFLEESSLSEQKAIIAHELAHLRRYDLWFHYGISLLRIVLWYLPSIYVLQKQLHTAQDSACDECAAVFVGSNHEFGEALTGYAEKLLNTKNSLPSLGFKHSGDSLLNRLQNIMSMQIAQLSRISFVTKFVFAFGFGVLFCLSGLTGQALLPKEWTAAAVPPILSNNRPENLFRKIYPMGSGSDNTVRVAYADLDGDNIPEAITLNRNEPSRIYHNDGYGKFTLIASFDIPDATVSDIAFGDMDEDGDIDMAVGYLKGSRNRIFLNDGQGQFDTSLEVSETDSTMAIDLGDFDHDGHLDWLTANQGPDYLYLNPGNGRFEHVIPIRIQDNLPDHTAKFADINNDGWLDIVIGNYDYGAKIFLNQEGHVQQEVISIDIKGLHGYSLYVADLDGDRDMDIICIGTNRILRLFQVEPLRFELSPSFRSFDPKCLALGDIDKDGDIDIAVGNDRRQQDIVYFNDGTGRFPTHISLAASSQSTSSITLFDVDRDGDLDITTGNMENQDSFSLGLENRLYINDLQPRVLNITYGPSHSDQPAFFPIQISFTHRMEALASQQISVHGSQSGRIEGTIEQNGSNQILFVPKTNLKTGEVISLTVPKELKTIRSTPMLNAHHQTWRIQGTHSAQPDWEALDIRDATDHSETVAAGDLNGDGFVDLAFGNRPLPNYVLLNDGNGGFLAPQYLNTDADWTTSVALVDIDWDGDLDIATCNEDYKDTHHEGWNRREARNRIYINDGRANFKMVEIERQGNEHPVCQTFGDVNGDGYPDWIVGNYHQYLTTIYYNDGNGFFSFENATTVIGDEGTTCVALGDADNDGDLDLAVGTNKWGSNYIYFNDGTGRFEAGVIETGYFPTQAVEFGDMDNDGDLDLVYSCGKNAIATILFLNPLGYIEDSFDIPYSSGNEGSIRDLLLADMDSDGDLDIIAPDEYGQNRIHFNGGLGRYFESKPFGTGIENSFGLDIADFNRDGTIDIALANKMDRNAVYYTYANTTNFASGKQ